VRQHLYGVVVASCLALAACGESSLSSLAPTSPSGLTADSGSGGRASVRQAGIQCSDAPIAWITGNFSPEGRSARIYWVPAPNVETYQVEVRHARDGQPRFIYGFFTNLTEASIDDKEDGGRYYVRVRSKNPCDIFGAWSETLIIDVGGNGGSGKVSTEPENPGGGGEEEPEEPSEDCEEDDNNGHGNDCDRDDDGNPGRH
jgi:hypothetical protein